MSTNQAITRTVFTATFTFTGKPSEETRKSLLAAGYQFDGKSKQWYRREEQSAVAGEEVIAQQLAA